VLDLLSDLPTNDINIVNHVMGQRGDVGPATLDARCLLIYDSLYRTAETARYVMKTI
jgi:hypothetical protein